MDCEQEERQFLGSTGVIKESIRIIFTWRKIFSQITLAFILPLSLIILAHMEICILLFEKVIPQKQAHGSAEADTPKYNKLSVPVTSGKIELLLFLVSFVLLVIFSFLSKGAVTCTTAHGYTLNSITFQGVMSTIPKVRKRLMITNSSVFLALYSYIIISTITLCLFARLHSPAVVVGLVIFFIIICLCVADCICRHLHLAGAVSVGKDIDGSEAMFMSKNLFKGKPGTSTAMCLLLLIWFLAIQSVFFIFVSHGHGSVFLRLEIAILCFLFLIMLLLFSLILQTVIYFMWKLYHHDNIDKLPLTDLFKFHLLAEYLPPKADHVKLEQANGYLDVHISQ